MLVKLYSLKCRQYRQYNSTIVAEVCHSYRQSVVAEVLLFEAMMLLHTQGYDAFIRSFIRTFVLGPEPVWVSSAIVFDEVDEDNSVLSSNTVMKANKSRQSVEQ